MDHRSGTILARVIVEEERSTTAQHYAHLNWTVEGIAFVKPQAGRKRHLAAEIVACAWSDDHQVSARLMHVLNTLVLAAESA